MVIEKNILMSVKEEDIIDGIFVVPQNIKAIGNSAFKNLLNLKKVVIHDKVQTIDYSAFEDCLFLTNVELPKGLTEISRNMFKGCSSLEKIDIPDSVEKINSGAFADCSSLKNIVIPKKVTSITHSAFLNCTSLEKIDLSKSIFIFQDSAFENCSSLKTINIPKSIKYIGASAFAGCSSLEEIELPEIVNAINDEAFRDCTSLKNIVFPRKLYTIKSQTFENCSELEEITLSEDLTTIEFSAFKNCHSLKKVTIPESVSSIDNSAFKNCYELESFDFPRTLKAINAYTFKNCKKLTKINLPFDLKVIGNEAFRGCENLSEVKINTEYFSTIKKDAFSDCPSLKELKLPFSLSSMKRISNSGLKYFQKNPFGFSLSSTQYKDSIELDKIKLDYAMFYHNQKHKDILLKEQNNPLVADFYENFLLTLSVDKIDNFFENYNFTFFKQLDISPTKNNIDIYRFLYNMGAFLGPINDYTFDDNNAIKSTKTVNYSQKVVGFIQERMKKENINIYDFVSRYSKMKCYGFNREFTDFYLKSYDELINQDNIQRNFISSCYDKFYDVQKTNTSSRGSQRQLKPTVDKFVKYFAEDKFKGVTKENEEIAKTIAPYFDYQHNFDHAVRIDKERKKKKTANNILSKPLKESDMFAKINYYADAIQLEQSNVTNSLVYTADNEFSFEWLEKNDPENFILGKLCSCCAHLDGAGCGIMRASIVHPYVQNLVIRNGSGEIVAKTTLYVNHKKGYGVCNNIEVSSNAQKTTNLEKIYDKIKLGLSEFAEAYNKEHPKKKLKQINVGMHLNDLSIQISEQDKVGKILKAINYKKYCYGRFNYNGDSSKSQYILWSDENSPAPEK